MKFKFFKHTADAKFQAYGKTMEEAFSNAAQAMFSILVDYRKIKPEFSEEIEVEGRDNEALLYSFLEELLFLLDTKGFLLREVKKMKIRDGKLVATLSGDIHLDQYTISGDIKAVTYNEMFVKEKDGVTVQVVVDL